MDEAVFLPFSACHDGSSVPTMIKLAHQMIMK
jgi:hypothetical protein